MVRSELHLNVWKHHGIVSNWIFDCESEYRIVIDIRRKNISKQPEKWTNGQTKNAIPRLASGQSRATS